MPWKSSFCFLALKMYVVFQCEGIHLAPLCYVQLLTLWSLHPRDLCVVVPTWRTSPAGQIKYTSKPVKIQLFVKNAVRNQSRSKKNYPSCLTYGVWKCCSPMLALSALPWGACRRCCNSTGTFSLVSACWEEGSRPDSSPVHPSSGRYVLMNFYRDSSKLFLGRDFQ